MNDPTPAEVAHTIYEARPPDKGAEGPAAGRAV